MGTSENLLHNRPSSQQAVLRFLRVAVLSSAAQDRGWWGGLMPSYSTVRHVPRHVPAVPPSHHLCLRRYRTHPQVICRRCSIIAQLQCMAFHDSNALDPGTPRTSRTGTGS